MQKPIIAVFLVIVSFLLEGCSTYSKVHETKRNSNLATTVEQLALEKEQSRLKGQPLDQLGLYLDSANTSRLRLAADSGDSLALSNYNFAVSRIIELVENQDYAPWDEPVICKSSSEGEWKLTLTPPDPRPEYHPSNFEIMPADRYRFKGSLVGDRVVKEGLGAPTIVIGRDMDFTQVDEFAQGKQVFYGLTAIVRFNGQQCELVLADPLEDETISLDGNAYPLGADFQAPAAMALAELEVKKVEIDRLFKPNEFVSAARLARLQPYNPKKIPVIFIHGLGNSGATWIPMIDSLREDAAIRKNYQFWFFSYPSGLPYPIPAAILREQLDKIALRYPNHKDIVVVGHSMGGMISRLLITDSNMTLWDSIYSLPPDQMPFDPLSREILSKSLIFEARPDISRVIYASASHRGSEDATNFAGRLGAKLIGDPIGESSVSKEAVAMARPGLDEASGRKRQLERMPNSIDLLNPESVFLKMVDTLPPKPGVPYHSIIGDRGKGGNLDKTKPFSSDGIVPYWSSHLEGATSEKIIPSEHWSIQHPQGIAETRRILLQHLREQ